MFENNIVSKRVLKKKQILDDLAKASEEKKDWKVKQLEGKLACLERKCYPKVVWESAKQGKYEKRKRG